MPSRAPATLLARRKVLAGAAGAGALALLRPTRAWAAAEAEAARKLGSMADLGFTELPEGTLGSHELYALPGKVRLIKKTFRPPNFETPIEYLRLPITRNHAFFVRWHNAAIPAIDIKDWVLTVGGDSVEEEQKFTYADLKKLAPAEITAVCQCAGNRRGLFEPRVPGVQWGAGAMGNAVWRGVRLKDVLEKIAIKPDAIEVVFDGADQAVQEPTPDYIKSLPLDVALDPNTLIAFEMNGQPLPLMNGFPARLVVPGWAGTYWVKALVGIQIVPKAESRFWMDRAYRLPRGLFNTPSFKSQVKETSEPITTLVANSLITSLKAGQHVQRGRHILVRGIAWDGGAGIEKVEVSVDSGASWKPARLGTDLGRFSFREFELSAPVTEPGTTLVIARATNRAGETQSEQVIHNPAGYHHNALQRIPVEVV
jgi:DMSO/TMAO reductase YedYZ molybdopterin-dependent catalytic subunit